MAGICPNRQAVFNYDGKYCSERCRRERRRQLQVLLASVVGVLVLAFAIYTAPSSDLRPEPNHPVSLAELQKLAHDDSCPVCDGKGKVDCKVCIDGKIFYMGTSVECQRSNGKAWILCPACKGTGRLEDALAAAAS